MEYVFIFIFALILVVLVWKGLDERRSNPRPGYIWPQTTKNVCKCGHSIDWHADGCDYCSCISYTQATRGD